MEPDKAITLKNGQKYGLLLESEQLDNYFLAVLLDANEKPTNTYTILEKVISEGKTFIRKIDDPIIMNQLLTDYESQYEDMLAA